MVFGSLQCASNRIANLLCKTALSRPDLILRPKQSVVQALKLCGVWSMEFVKVELH